ncbi:RICIN domain-containing protein [Actinoallomurus purpureus]|uniref:RICIN domain-containing protein n=1 Tax=Actinoallomurus purpureus TaxID=478114 RepID=UPI00209351C2|nr:RICIN domain-containing protein [Actinoallomurus purpureus]MCO6009027.1 RICIN domain-containing protein [Actinoallomurus purpureus]
MKKPPFTRRFAAAAAIATAAVTCVATPAHADTFWTFKNRQTGKCLTFGTSSVWATSCNGSTNQQWDWVPSNYDNGFDLLRARGTDQCLRTDKKTSKNSTWLSTCDRNAWGELFQYQYSTQAFVTADFYYVTMDPGSSQGVYTESPTPGGYYSYWYGTHT